MNDLQSTKREDELFAVLIAASREEVALTYALRRALHSPTEDNEFRSIGARLNRTAEKRREATKALLVYTYTRD